MEKNRLVHLSIIGIFVSLYFLVATISMINSVAFFDLAHSGLMNWALAIGFEIGAAASLAAIVILDKTNKTMVWGLFLLLTSFQMMANSFHAFINLEDYMGWIELFGLEEAEPLYQKRILSIVSGAILPLVALGFIKSLVDYVRPESTVVKQEVTDEGPYTFETDKEVKELEKEEVILEVDEELPIKDLYSRDAITAKPPVVVGEVRIAPETVTTIADVPRSNTANTVADVVEKPTPTVQITPAIEVPINTKPKKPPLVSRPFIRSVNSESKP